MFHKNGRKKLEKLRMDRGKQVWYDKYVGRLPCGSRPCCFSYLFADESLKYLPYGILGDLPVRLALEEELFDLQSIQLSHIGFIGIAGQDHHVGDLTDLQTASLLLVEGHPAGVVGTHFQCLLDGHGLGTIVAGFVNPHDGVGIGAGAVGAKGLDNTVIGIGLEGVQLCGTVAQDGFQVFVRLVGPVDEGTLNCQGDAIFGTDADTLLGGQTGVDVLIRHSFHNSIHLPTLG